ncbi:hypothetical protein P4661_27275 [Priestia megaterium]|uniref:hypothetical protein n=1 Tax=Priestia megaterium TaxID=1404 RepID=UPI002E1EA2CE|nr:hypothetical protein [Priestia megaterium]
MALVFDTSAFYSPAVDGRGFETATIYINSSANGTLDVDISGDGQSFTDYGTSAVTAGQTAVFNVPLTSTNGFIRYSVTGAATDTVTSSVALS